MRLKHELRQLFWRFGIDVVRYPLHNPLARTAKLLAYHRINCVIDVGANDGGFALGIRQLGYRGRIISFEPLQAPFEVLRSKAVTDPNWTVLQYAVGDCAGEVVVNIAGDSVSSSVLPMLPSHVGASPNSNVIGTQTARQVRLDSIDTELCLDPDSRNFLKIDVEGYEHAVLDGASGLFADGAITGLQLELSLVPLYEGAMTYREGLDRAERLGMTLMGIDPVFGDQASGQLLQMDAVFFTQ
jgi:FkbM family methyltransferase